MDLGSYATWPLTCPAHGFPLSFSFLICVMGKKDHPVPSPSGDSEQTIVLQIQWGLLLNLGIRLSPQATLLCAGSPLHEVPWVIFSWARDQAGSSPKKQPDKTSFEEPNAAMAAVVHEKLLSNGQAGEPHEYLRRPHGATAPQ